MMEILEEEFSLVACATMPSGIYVLVSKGQVVYVGKSKSIYWRIAQHHQARNKPKRNASRVSWHSPGQNVAFDVAFDEVWVQFCAPEDLERLELKYIDRFKPKWNIQIRQPLPDIKVDLQALAAKMNWDFKRKDRDGFRRRRDL